MIECSAIEFHISILLLAFFAAVISNRITVWLARMNAVVTDDDINAIDYKCHQYEELILFREMYSDYPKEDEIRCLERSLALDSRLLIDEIKQIRKIL